MSTLRKKYHELGNKINNALLFIGTVKKDLARRNDAGLQRSVRDCELAEQELLAMARQLDAVKSVTYRLADPDKNVGELEGEFQSENRNVRLLFVDDEARLCGLLERNYTARGFRVWIATNPAEAKEKLVEAAPHILVLDLYFDQGMEGADILRFARKENPGVKCLVVSREFDEGRLQGIRDLGVDGILKKPIMADELEAQINALVSSLGTKNG